ncbi:MAG: GNAT family N-acetyltransferase [Desulfobacteraceae bacterium]|nr:MAG: GNAT family N-acetyltransferase [Desulfobacteraceae bacterium]
MPQSTRYPKELILKDHREIIMKPFEEMDKERLLEFYKNLPVSQKWFLKEDPSDISVIKKWIDSQNDGKAFSLAAFYEDRIVAHGTILQRLFGGRRHVGRLRIMVASDFRQIQLGTWMVFDLLRRGMEMGIEKIRADFVVGIDDPVIEAFKKLDFIEEAVLRDYVKDEKGNYYNYKIMIKQLHKELSDF